MAFEVSVCCPDCGLGYIKGNGTDEMIHKARHKTWVNACNMFGYLRSYDRREKDKERIRADISQCKKKNSKHIASLYESLMHIYFERSVMAMHNDYKKHCDFPTYVSYLLYQKNWKEHIINNDDVYDILVKKYGTRRGMVTYNGTESTYYSDCYKKLK